MLVRLSDELIHSIFAISIFDLIYRVLERRLLKLESLITWALCWICLRLKCFGRKLFIRPEVIITLWNLKGFCCWFAHAKILLFLAWTLTLIRFILFDFNISSPSFGIKVVASCHWFLNFLWTVGVILFAIVFLGHISKLRPFPFGFLPAIFIPHYELSGLR